MVASSSNATGFHNNSYGWQFKWENGTAYVFKNSYGGGTQATVLDSSNYNSYAPTLTGGGASGTWGISITGSSNYVAHYSSRTDSTWYNAVWASGNPSHMYSCDAVQILSSAGALRANIYYDNQDTAYYLDPNSTSNLYIAKLQGITDHSYARLLNPQGGISINNGPQSASIKIKLPTAASFTNSMMSFTVQIYNYSTGTSRTIRCGGYTYFTTDWYNVFAYQIGDNDGGNLTVRFGKDATGACVWIGETNTAWDYPNVFVTDIQAGHSQPASMAVGWSVTLVTSFDTVQTSRVAYYQINAGNIGSQSVDFNNLTNKTGGTGTYQTSGDFRAPIFYDSNDTTYYLDPNSGSYLRGRINVTGGHYNSSLRVFLRADENGASTGEATLQMWVSEPNVSWAGAGFGYNVTND
jgi:hypothetical protein